MLQVTWLGRLPKPEYLISFADDIDSNEHHQRAFFLINRWKNEASFKKGFPWKGQNQ